jgi:hypothetical protein
LKEERQVSLTQICAARVRTVSNNAHEGWDGTVESGSVDRAKGGC